MVCVCARVCVQQQGYPYTRLMLCTHNIQDVECAEKLRSLLLSLTDHLPSLLHLVKTSNCLWSDMMCLGEGEMKGMGMELKVKV